MTIYDWIPVTDHLPMLSRFGHYSAEVIVSVDYSPWGRDRIVAVDYRDEKGWIRHPSELVTHWMHFPDLPESLKNPAQHWFVPFIQLRPEFEGLLQNDPTVRACCEMAKHGVSVMGCLAIAVLAQSVQTKKLQEQVAELQQQLDGYKYGV